ncbi:hypothetical protein [Zhongshania sp.]|jgi:hypothetical protein|uniref:hypothetical protein n=1 Tax=Zhongshania sp. TaxID=1971902 RepID=UPI0039E5CC90
MTIVNHLKTGEHARLISTLPDSKKEEKATSALLATFRVIPEFAKAVLSEAGATVGSRAKIDCYTEVVFKSDELKNMRPDGLIVVNTGKKEWSALVESKIGNASLSVEQVEKYLGAAKALGIDALITISNDYAVLPTHHPLIVSKQAVKKVELYHFSWLSIISKAVLLSDNKVVNDPEQAFLLGELIRYFRATSSGVSALTKMSQEWREVCDHIQQGAVIQRQLKDVEGAVGSWNQLLRYLSLQLSMATRSAVSIQLPKKLQACPEEQVKDAVESVLKSSLLTARLEVPNAAGPIQITADFMRRTVSLDMKLTSPQDVKRPSAAINWLTRQLKDSTEAENIMVKAYWPKRTTMTMKSLKQVLENPDLLVPAGIKDIPKELEIGVVIDLAGRFRGSKTFIEETEKALLHFYDTVGEHLNVWVAKAPRIQPPKADSNRTSVDALVGAAQEEPEREGFFSPVAINDDELDMAEATE